MKKKISALIGVLLCFTILFSSITVFAGDFVDYANPTYQARVETLGFPNQADSHCFISADSDGNLHYIGASGNFTVVTFEYQGVTYGIYRCSDSTFSVYDAALSSDWSLVVSQGSPLYVAFGPEPYDNFNNFWDSAVSAGKVSSSGWKYCMYGGNQLVYDGGSAGVDLIYSNYFDTYPWDDNGGTGSDSDNGYNDSSFKGLVTDLFDHLFNVLLYGEDEGYDGTDVDNSVQWLEDLSDDMEDITVKLNQAPDYIRNGFTAVTGAQTAINDFFTGISTAIPIIYYGIVGILNIIIIRKIIGR